MTNDNMMHDHVHDHENEMLDLSDEDLAQVSGGAKAITMCPCQRHKPRPDAPVDTM